MRKTVLPRISLTCATNDGIQNTEISFFAKFLWILFAFSMRVRLREWFHCSKNKGKKSKYSISLILFNRHTHWLYIVCVCVVQITMENTFKGKYSIFREVNFDYKKSLLSYMRAHSFTYVASVYLRFSYLSLLFKVDVYGIQNKNNKKITVHSARLL